MSPLIISNVVFTKFRYSEEEGALGVWCSLTRDTQKEAY